MRLTRFLVLGLCFAVAVPVLAQFTGGRQPTSLSSLLTNASVQKELSLTEEQTGKFKTIIDGVREKFKDELAKGKFDKEVFKKVGDATAEAINKDLASILKPEQLKRLKQIEIQQLGLGALAKDDVAKELALTAAQKEKIKGLTDDLEKDVADIRKDLTKGKFDPKVFEKITEARTATFEKATGVLDETQKKKWKDLTGEKFKLEFGKTKGKGA